MPRKKIIKASLKLVSCEPIEVKIEPEVDELALLIRSINEMGSKAKAKASQSPDPPKAA